MKKWILKAIIQKIITFLPFSFKINYFFQKYITKHVHLTDEFFDIMLEHFDELFTFYTKNNFNFNNKKAVELGTGWHPIMPFMLFLIGAKEITTLDLRTLIRKENLKTLFKKIIEYHSAGKFDNYNWTIQKKNLDKLKIVLEKLEQLSISEILEQCNIQQIIVDANQTKFTTNNFDFCYSVNVLEHVDIKSIKGISKEFYRISKPDSLHYHAIGVYDHFVHVDQSISKFNYLKFSAKKWEWIDNGIQPQNRKRISYFRKVFLEMGYTILDEILWDSEPEELTKIKVHQDFENEEELDIPYGTFILKK